MNFSRKTSNENTPITPSWAKTHRYQGERHMKTQQKCPLRALEGKAKIIAASFLDDRSTTPEQCVAIVAPYLPRPITVREIKKHRTGQCDCISLNLETLISQGEISPDPTRPNRYSAPKGWEPGVSYDPTTGIPTEVTTDVVSAAETEEDWLATVKAMGIVLPDGYTVQLLRASFDPAAWHRDEEGGDAVTRAVWRYKFAVVPCTEVLQNADDIIQLVEKHRPIKRPEATGDGSAFMVVYGDMQIGKRDDLGGTEETIERILTKTDLAVERLKELRKGGRVIDSIYIPVLGDCIEGFTSQNGRLAFRQDLAPTEQVRVYRRLLLHIVKTFAPLANRVVLPVVPGNHDEVQRNIATYHNDDFATDGASAVADALEMNPEAFGHCSFVFPQHDRSTVTLNIEGTVTGFAHGHQMRLTQKDGAHAWWGQMAHGMQPIGEAVLLITAHYHHLRVLQPGAKTWIQIPALDNGSRWFTEKSGNEAPAGLVTLTVGNGKWDDLKLV
jgi:hypothetical protein